MALHPTENPTHGGIVGGSGALNEEDYEENFAKSHS